jgi:hypothetical protein
LILSVFAEPLVDRGSAIDFIKTGCLCYCQPSFINLLNNFQLERLTVAKRYLGDGLFGHFLLLILVHLFQDTSFTFSPFHLSTSKTPFHLSTSKTPFHLQRSCHPRSVFAQRMKQKTPAALRGFILVGGKFRQGFIKVYFLMGLKAPISAAFGPLALMD